MKPIFVVFDGPPSHDSGRFVEVEAADGKSVSAGEWKQSGEYWNLGPFYTADQVKDAQVKALETAYRHVLCLPAKARVSDALDELRRMADELEKQ